MKDKTLLLLLHFGTPKSHSYRDITHFLLKIFASKEMGPFLRLLRFLLAPIRALFLKKKYQLIGQLQDLQLFAQKLQNHSLKVQLASCFGTPSIDHVLKENKEKGFSKIILLPLFPQNTPWCTLSAIEKVCRLLPKYQYTNKVTIITHFFNHPLFIKALANQGKPFVEKKEYDAIIFTFHGVPKKAIKKDIPNYEKECRYVAEQVAQELNIDPKKWHIAFQSKFGLMKWTEPSVNHLTDQLLKEEKKSFLLFSPSFIGENIETLYEIGYLLRKRILSKGGKELSLVGNIVSSPIFVETVKELVLSCQE